MKDQHIYRKKIKERIIQDVFKKAPEHLILSQEGAEDLWIFDFRRILLIPEVSDAIVALFWSRYETFYPFQIGGLETSSIPIISAIVYDSFKRGTPVNGFYVRKSRKKTGLLNAIEGSSVDQNVPIILIDDLMNSGGSFEKTMKTVIDHVSSECKFIALFSVLRYRKKEEYTPFLEKGILVDSIFELDDFTADLGVANINIKDKIKTSKNPYPIIWKWQESFSSYWKVTNIQSFNLDGDSLFVGTDKGGVVSLDKKTGKMLFATRVTRFIKNNDVHSSILVTKSRIVFATLQGELYVVNKESGAVIFKEAVSDSIGNQLVLNKASDEMVYVRKYSFLRKKFEIAAFSLKNFKHTWIIPLTEDVVAGPVTDSTKSSVMFLLSTGELICLSIKTGKVKWKEKLCEFGIIEQASISTQGESVFITFLHKLEFPSAYLYVVNEKSGQILLRSLEFCEFYVNEPVFFDDKIIVTSVSKQMFIFEKRTLKLLFSVSFDSRVFAKPLVIKDGLLYRIFVGTNDAKYTEFSGATFEVLSVTYFSERLLHSGVYDKENGYIYLRTQANQVFCLDVHKK